MIKIIFTFHGRVIVILSLLAVLVAFPYTDIVRIVVGAIVLSTLGLLGVHLSRSVGLKLELTNKSKSVLYRITEALLIGAITALFVLTAVKLFSFIIPELASRFKHDASTSNWQITRIVIYAPIFEEIAFRLFLMTLVIWILNKFAKQKSERPRDNFLKWAIFISSVLFAFAHLPAWLQVTNKVEVYLLVILLNMIASYAFSWMFYTCGIYLAMVAHFAADVVGHIVGARLMFGE